MADDAMAVEEPAVRVEEGQLVFFGEKFTLPDERAEMAVLRFAHLAEKRSITDLQEKAAVYDLLEASIAPDEWDRFQTVAMKRRATEGQLLQVVSVVMVELSGRPTSRSSASSDGPPTAAPSSTSTPEERAIAQLAGRPDLQNVVDLTSKARAS